MRPSRHFPLLLLAVWTIVAVYIILRDPLELGPDEGMEHAKALLVSLNPAAVSLEWNDQPWFYSYVFGTLARADLTLMRLASLGLFVAAAGWMAAVLVRRHGVAAGLVAVASLLTWTVVPTLAVSAMCEIPSYSLMLLAGLVVLAHEKPAGRAWLYPLAGALAGVALAIKLTALLLLPFVVWVVLTAQENDAFRTPLQRFWRRGVPFCLAIVGTFIFCMVPGDSLNGQFLAPHIKASLVDDTQKYVPMPGDFLPAAGSCLFAVGGLLFVRGGQSRRLVVAAGLSLLCMIVVHSIHRPFWWFYRVHFAFPLSVLAGIGAAACLSRVGLQSARSAFRLLFGLSAGCLFVTTNLPECWRELSGKAQAVRVGDDAMLSRIASLRTHDGYGFGWRSILLSRAGRLAVPGLTIVSRKRYWTGEGSDELIIDAVRSFRPVLLVLHDRQLKDPLWQQWLAEEYLQTYSSGEDLLYVRRDLNPVPELITIDQIRALGL